MITFLIIWFALGFCSALWILIETVVIDKEITIGHISISLMFILFGIVAFVVWGSLMLQKYSDVVIYKRKVK